MQLTYLTVPLVAALAAAQNSTTLPDLVSQLPTCALSCLEKGASSVGCAVTDFSCLCNAGSNFTSSVGPCVVLSSGCSSADQSKVESLAPEICADVNDGASSADLSSASAVATSIIATASATATGNGAAATPMAAGLGMMGGLAAFAAIAL